ncbi:MAG: aspartate--tRNA ligase [Deltaproteobacteria bacterium]|nr:aspartate--tRNA ligase [Deltaproteobacteria bacterium]
MAASEFLTTLKRTHTCGQLRAGDVGNDVVLMGWVDSRRDHGGRVFIDLRDRDGITQVVFGPDYDAAAHALAGELRGEFCIGVRGKVISRGTNINPKIPTGTIELEATSLEIFSRSETPPFQIEDGIDTAEAIRLKHRDLDLRRPELQKNFIVRSKIYQSVRNTLTEERFLELETPFMGKYTPGGARNFLVPSRLNPHHFYALAESPQLYKQLFMVAGMDRYFQIVRCFRDEDLRQDRQPEFTQIDLELSFVVEEDVQRVVEKLIVALWKDAIGADITAPFQRMTYDEAMSKYGVDKPDLRFDLPLGDITEAAGTSGFKVFDDAVAAGGIVKALRIPAPGGEKLSRKDLDGLTDFAKPYGVRGVAYVRVNEGGAWQGAPAKATSESARTAINTRLGAVAGDVILFVADKAKTANTTMGAIRLEMGRRLDLIQKDAWRFLWVTDFPLFERGDAGNWVASHHPFTSPKLEDLPHLESDPGRVRARAYDLVLNGNEIAGGSIRIHQAEVQARAFRALGLSDDEARAKFGFLLEAFKYGPPPHGGIAFGLDRLAMLLCGADSLRDVIAFPKTQKGTDLMTEAPVEIQQKQLDELHITIKK